jgi:hypothetical protein
LTPDDPGAVLSRIMNACQKLDAALDELDDLGGLHALPLSPKMREKLRGTLREARRALDYALKPKTNKDTNGR